MRASRPRTWRLAALMTLAITRLAHAHSASDAYLTLTAEPAAVSSSAFVIHGQWDIALRDLDFVLKLDDDGDGRLTWSEVRRHKTAIERYAYRFLALHGGADTRCSIKPGALLIDDHADGAYAALFFEAICARAPQTLSLHYSLFFAIDPSHRGIFTLHASDGVATALLSPQNAQIDLALQGARGRAPQ